MPTPFLLRPVIAGRCHCCILTLVLGAVAARAWPADDPNTPVISDETVSAAIDQGVKWIKDHRNGDGHWETSRNENELHWAGSSALALLALLYAGEDPQQLEMTRSLDWLMRQRLNGTYTYGVRAHVFALVRVERWRLRLREDLDWLLKAAWPANTDCSGGYDYTPPREDATTGRCDNSVSQYGILGVWMAAEAGLEVPDSFWMLVRGHWLRNQNADGGWGYQQENESTGSMTAAGVASLFVVLDQLYADKPDVARDVRAAIQRGLDWLGREYGPANPHGDDRWHHYYLYGVERVGRASGYKYIRGKDWFRDGAVDLLRRQQSDGSWRSSGEYMDDLRNTAFALMFLCHGRAPLLYNKLELGPQWDAQLRDVAGLTRFAQASFERLMNWQIVGLDGEMDDLLEAPVLYLYGGDQAEFSAADALKIRECCQRGTLFFAVAARTNPGFKDTFEDLARRAFPEYPVRELAADHPLFSGAVQFPIDKPPRMLEVNNGVRTLMLCCPEDVAAGWNRGGARVASRRSLEIGCNVYQYAVDKTVIRSRLQTVSIPLVPRDTTRTLRVARIQYRGTWDIEPFGWSRLRNYLNNETNTLLLVTSGITLDSEALQEFDVAHLTGTDAFELTDAEVAGLRRFLTGGGTLVADAAGGNRGFTESLEKYLEDALGTRPQLLTPDSYILTGAGIPGAVDLKDAEYRRAARGAAGGREYPRIKAFIGRRRIYALYSPLDLSTGLIGTPVYDVRGYAPESALRIMRNLLVYTNLSSADKSRLEREQ